MGGVPASKRVGPLGRGEAVEAHVGDHAAAAEERRHRRRGSRREPTGRRCRSGPSILWPEKREEVDVEVGHVGRRVGDELGGVDGDERSVAVGRRGELAHRVIVPSTLDIADDRDQLHALHQPVEVGEVEAEVVGHGDEAHLDAGAARAAGTTGRCWRGAPSR